MIHLVNLLKSTKGVSKMSFIDWRKIDGCKNE